MLSLAQLEACVKVENLEHSIFKGNAKKQLEGKHWIGSKQFSIGRLFSVKNLDNALEALIDISYEGEGGAACTPYISSIEGGHKPLSLISKSHFIKFQEMAYERQIIAFTENLPKWSEVACLNQESRYCACVLNNGNITYNVLSRKECLQFCYAGPSLTLDETEVWPIESLPEKEDLLPPEVRQKADEFDIAYTNLLHCLGKLIRHLILHLQLLLTKQ